MAKLGNHRIMIHVHAGLQPQQYVTQLREAGFFEKVRAAGGAERRKLQHSAEKLVADLRSGRVMPDTKEHAAALGLRIYPD